MREYLIALVCVFLLAGRVSAVELTISDIEVIGKEITLTASLSASTNYYLQGALRSQSSSKYFCETKNTQNNWVDYVSSPDKEYIVSNFFLTDIKESTWSGELHLRYKVDDPHYSGPGLYDLKIRRYTGNSSSSAGESNTLTITLNEPLPTTIPTQTPNTPTPTPSQAPQSTSEPTVEPLAIPSIFPSPKLLPSPTATIAGVATEISLEGFGNSPSPSPVVGSLEESIEPKLRTDRLKTVITVGIGLMILFVSSYLGYSKYIENREI